MRDARGPFCLSRADTVLVPELRPPARWLATIAPSQSSDVRIVPLKPSPKFHPTSPESVSECVMNSYTDCSRHISSGKSERARKASNKETHLGVTERRTRRDARRGPRNRLNEVCSHCPIYYVYLTDTRWLTSPQGEADVRRLEGL